MCWALSKSIPAVTFGTPENRMSIAALKGEPEEDLAALRAAVMHESDPEMTAILSRAAEGVGIEWRPPCCPEHLMLDD